jgi:hypothetical protein
MSCTSNWAPVGLLDSTKPHVLLGATASRAWVGDGGDEGEEREGRQSRKAELEEKLKDLSGLIFTNTSLARSRHLFGRWRT